MKKLEWIIPILLMGALCYAFSGAWHTWDDARQEIAKLTEQIKGQDAMISTHSEIIVALQERNDQLIERITYLEDCTLPIGAEPYRDPMRAMKDNFARER